MKLGTKSKASTGETEIHFPMLECWNPQTKVASIAAQVNKERVMCRIALRELKERFGASDDQPMLAVVENRRVIERSARRMIEAKAFEEDGSILLRSQDIVAN